MTISQYTAQLAQTDRQTDRHADIIGADVTEVWLLRAAQLRSYVGRATVRRRRHHPGLDGASVRVRRRHHPGLDGDSGRGWTAPLGDLSDPPLKTYPISHHADMNCRMLSDGPQKSHNTENFSGRRHASYSRQTGMHHLFR